ncbi:MAG: extracellular solute-binding protein [Clostridia bacterium]|nr:extracellular solute-binding protein [Clostridia bacterium]
MRILKKALCLILAFGLVFSATACGGGASSGVKGTLAIASFEGGYGRAWLDELIKAYKKHNPEANIADPEVNALVRDEAVTAFQTNVSEYDIFFIDGINMGSYCETYGSLADLSAVYTSTPKAGDKEENITIAQKIRPEVLSEMQYGGDRYQYKGKYYAVPTASGPCSLILNVDALNYVLGEGNWSEPRTTDELIALADAIKEAKKKITIEGIQHTVYPMIYSGKALEYWRYLYYTWMAQLGGDEAWEQFNTLKIDGEYNKAAYQPEGKLEAYQMLEKLIKRDNKYCDTDSMGNEFKESQKYFLQGKACMYICGDWLEKEMEESTKYNAELIMVKTPIISDLAAKLESDYAVSLGSTDAEKDAKLAEIVSAIDNGATSFDGISAEAFAKIKKSRAYTFTLANSAIAVVPSCSVNQDMVLDFFRFMYSDEGIQIVLDYSKGYLPIVNSSDFVYNGTPSTFRQSVNKIANGEITYLFTSSRDPIRYRAGVDSFLTTEKPETALGKKSGAVSAYAYLQTEKTLLDSLWEDFMDAVQ